MELEDEHVTFDNNEAAEENKGDEDDEDDEDEEDEEGNAVEEFETRADNVPRECPSRFVG
jgi:hypothetical protein